MRTSHLCIRLEDFSKVALGDGSEATMRTSNVCIRLEYFSKDAIGDGSEITIRMGPFSKVAIFDASPKR